MENKWDYCLEYSQIYENTKIRGTQQGKIHIVWQSTKTTRHAKNQENTTNNEEKKTINWSYPRTDIDIRISRQDIQTVIIAAFHMFKKLETGDSKGTKLNSQR